MLDPNLPSYLGALGQIESGNDYGALGPVTKTGDRAYGKYQVMGANVPQWTQAALGYSMSPQEFLKNPQAQDAVATHRFGNYLQGTGNPEDAASMWFSGRPMAQAGNASDGYNTVPQYVSKFDAALKSTGKTPMANVFQMAQQQPQQDQGQPPTLFGGNPTPIGMAGGLLRMLGVGSEPDLGRRLQNAGAGLIAVGNPQGGAALQNAANLPLLRQRFSLTRDSYGNLIAFDNRTGQLVNPATGMPNGNPQATTQPGTSNPTAVPGQPTTANNWYATSTPSGIKALADAQIQQSVKDKAALAQSAQQAAAIQGIVERQLELSKDPDVIQGALADPRLDAAAGLSLLTGGRYGKAAAAKTDEFNTNNKTLVGLMAKGMLGSNAKIAGPEISYVSGTKPSNENQPEANQEILQHIHNLTQRTLYAADLANKTPVLDQDFYDQVNKHFAQMPGYNSTSADKPVVNYTPKGNVDPNAFWKK